MSNNPSSKAVREVAARLRSVLPMAEKETFLAMSNACIGFRDRSWCGTPICHAGYYSMARPGAIATGLFHVDYKYGMDRIAGDLGFETVVALMIWARGNPKIWGNDEGDNMFATHTAFESQTRPNGALTLQHIIDHWEEVADRLEAIEKEQQRRDITSELCILPPQETVDTVKQNVNISSDV